MNVNNLQSGYSTIYLKKNEGQIVKTSPISNNSEENISTTAPQMPEKIAFYKDCFIPTQPCMVSKAVIAGNTEQKSAIPQNKEELFNALKSKNKYSPEEINKITNMVDEIIESDEWEETEESSICEMFDALSNSPINSDIKTLEKISNKICKLKEEDYDDETDLNILCKGISAFCDILPSDSFEFDVIFNGGYDGLLYCENQNLVNKFCDLIKDSVKDVKPFEFEEFLSTICKNVNGNNKNLEKTYANVFELNSKYGLKDSDLTEGIVIHYKEHAPIDSIAEKIQFRKAAEEISERLNTDVTMFKKTFGPAIEELMRRNHTIDEITNLLSIDAFYNKISVVENIGSSDPVIFADFIEDIPNYIHNYDVMQSYTEGSGIFNNILSDTNGKLDEIPDDIVYHTEDRTFTSGQAKSEINELTSFLNNCHLKRDMMVYRGEGFEVLNQQLLENGELLGNSIKEAIENKDINKLNEITSELQGSIITQPHFMSTAYSEEAAKFFIKHEQGILWNINAHKGANAIYADPFNTVNGHENEILFNRGYSLLIKDAKLDGDIYTIYADLI